MMSKNEFLALAASLYDRAQQCDSAKASGTVGLILMSNLPHGEDARASVESHGWREGRASA